jgi:hypothetical protein
MGPTEAASPALSMDATRGVSEPRAFTGSREEAKRGRAAISAFISALARRAAARASFSRLRLAPMWRSVSPALARK